MHTHNSLTPVRFRKIKQVIEWNGKAVIITLLALTFHITALGQAPVRVYSEKDKNTFIGFSGMLQLWGRYTELNPGSTVDHDVEGHVYDFSVRRYRLQMYGQVNTKTKFNFQIGNNNINYQAGSGSPKLLDAYVEYQPANLIAFGFGKSGWTGLSRYAAPGSGSALDVDISYMATPLVNINDSFLRKIGFFVHGQHHGWDYRAIISKPYSYQKKESVTSARATFANGAPSFQTSAYIKYQFKDKETQTPFSTGTYFGEKNILNTGIGFLYQPHTTVSLQHQDTTYHPLRLFAIDVFYERHLNATQAFTFYLSYLSSDMGPKFVRNIGANNPVDINSTSSSFNGNGNNMPVTGTGNLFNLQLAYLYKIIWNKTEYKIQPFTTVEYGKLKALNTPLFIYDAGMNCFIHGHHSKITLSYQSRPVYVQRDNRVVEQERKAMIIIQYQFKIG